MDDESVSDQAPISREDSGSQAGQGTGGVPSGDELRSSGVAQDGEDWGHTEVKGREETEIIGDIVDDPTKR